MKKFLAVGALALVATASLTGCVPEEKSYGEYLLEKQIECAEVGGHIEVYKDRSNINGKATLCILPGTEVHLEKNN